jgi:hypothetical protein
MSKLIYTKFHTVKLLGFKILDFRTDYVERYTDEDSEEIQDEIRLHELKGKTDEQT